MRDVDRTQPSAVEVAVGEATVGGETATPDAEATVGGAAATFDAEATVGGAAATFDAEATVGGAAATFDAEATVGGEAATPDRKALRDAPSAQEAQQPEITGFRVALANFDGPFDLLLQLIHSHKLDITEVALAQVTDEFIAYTKGLSSSAEDLDEVTEFLVVAATLLDLKAARLVPRGEVEDEADLQLLESRDLLFARLLQYRAYKQVAEMFAQWQRDAARRYPAQLSLEEKFANLLPPVELGHTPESFADVAASVFRPRPTGVNTDHLHRPTVSVPEQAGHVLNTLKIAGVNRWVSFTNLINDAEVSMVIVGRFLALLELYKARAIGIEQPEPLGEMSVAWTGLDVDPAVVAASNWE